MSSGRAVLLSLSLFGILLPTSLPSCGPSDPTVEFHLKDGYSFSAAERRAIEAVAADAVGEVRGALPMLPHGLVLKVEAGHDVIRETGESGTAIPPALVWWDVDPRHPGGVQATVDCELRGALFHHLHHLVRSGRRRDRTFVDTIVSEGMAVAFERDFAHVARPWAAYGDGVEDLARQVLALRDEAAWNGWLQADKDTRRWTAQRVGAYLVDCAARASNQTAATMVTTSTDEVIRLAGVR